MAAGYSDATIKRLVSDMQSYDTFMEIEATRKLVALAEGADADEAGAAIEDLVIRLRAVSNAVREIAVCALAKLVQGTDVEAEVRRQHIVNAIGFLPALSDYFYSHCKIMQESAACILEHLLCGTNAEAEKRRQHFADIGGLGTCFRSGNEAAQRSAARVLANLTEGSDVEAEVRRQRIINRYGIISELGICLIRGCQIAQENAACTLANLAVGADAKADMRRRRIVNTGGMIAALVTCLGSGCEIVQENAARALANLAVGADAEVDARCQRIADEAGAIAALVTILRDGGKAAQEVAAHALANLAVGTDVGADVRRQRIVEEAGGIAVLAKCLKGNEGLQSHIIRLLVNLSCNSKYSDKVFEVMEEVYPARGFKEGDDIVKIGWVQAWQSWCTAVPEPSEKERRQKKVRLLLSGEDGIEVISKHFLPRSWNEGYSFELPFLSSLIRIGTTTDREIGAASAAAEGLDGIEWICSA